MDNGYWELKIHFKYGYESWFNASLNRLIDLKYELITGSYRTLRYSYKWHSKE